MPPLGAEDDFIPQAITEMSGMAKKTTCSITHADFRAKAKAVTVTIDGAQHFAEVKEFATGSLGWYLNGKTTIEIGGQRVPVQINASLIIVGSKDIPKEGGTATEAKSAEG